MEINMSHDEFRNYILNTTATEVIDFLEANGLELTGFEKPPTGIYRREEGSDLIRFNETGEWNRVSWQYPDEGDSIAWSCMDYSGDGDWWIQVLDEDNRPVHYGDRVRFNADGKRTA